MKKLILVFALLTITMLALVIQEAYKITQREEFAIDIEESFDCNLHQEVCSFNVPNLGTGKFSLMPRPIRMNQNLQAMVKTDFSEQVEMWVDFMGVDVYMGYNRPKLNGFQNHYEGQVFLPTCTAKHMTWKATILVKHKDKTYGYSYQFLTERE
jgi:hypothetical protein